MNKLLIIVTILLLGCVSYAVQFAPPIEDDIYQVYDYATDTYKVCKVYGSGTYRKVVCY